jgi:uncharacterized protein YfaS (alpha-2-macroglobulin family)
MRFFQFLFVILWILAPLINCSSHGEFQGKDHRENWVQQKKITREPLPEIIYSQQMAPGWKDVKAQMDEQKYEQAAKRVEGLLAQAKSDKNAEEWVRSLIRSVQLRIALHGYKTAAHFLKEQPWPKDLLSQAVLHLFYAHSLATYANHYSWEIRHREKIVSKNAINLKNWTMEQIATAINQAYAQIFAHRKQLGHYPIAHLREYIQVNNYPRGIRSTLRDAVSYQWASFLANTSYWRPGQSNQIYQLDMEKLLKQTHFSERLTDDKATHPLVMSCAIFDDLEAWHRNRKKPEPAFEAHLSKLRQLHASFSRRTDRDSIRQHLRQVLPQVRPYPWWAQGMSTLADFVLEDPSADTNIRAKEIALPCTTAYPNSIGGKHCFQTIQRIEAKDFNLQAMATDGMDRRSIAIYHKNLKDLYFRAYNLDVETLIASSNDYNLLPNRKELRQHTKSHKADFQWQVGLEATPDYRMHRQYVVPPIKKPGFYLLVASATKNFDRQQNKLQAVFMSMSDLVFQSRHNHKELEVEVLSGRTGRPIKGVQVRLYKTDNRNKHRITTTKTSDETGRVRFNQSSTNHDYFLLAKKGQQITLDPDGLYFSDPQRAKRQSSTLIYTDRSVYRPLQTIHFKAVAYQGNPDKGQFNTWPKKSLTITLQDANNKEISQRTLTTNAFGTASGEFKIPAGRLLGVWRIKSSLTGSTSLRVEEYKRPTFEVTLLAPKKPLRLNHKATIEGESRTYFGLAVTKGSVLWRVTRQPVNSQTHWIATGSATLDDNGHFGISFNPKADERLASERKGVSYRYVVSVDVTDEGGETREASRTFHLGFVDVEAKISTDTGFFMANKPAKLSIQRSNLDKTPKAGQAQYQLMRLKSPKEVSLPAELPLTEMPGQNKEVGHVSPGDKIRPRWDSEYDPWSVLRTWQAGKIIVQGALTHDKEGQAIVETPPLPAGAYRISYTTKDAFGASFETAKEFIVAGTSPRLKLAALLEVKRKSVAVGQTARILVQSGLDDQLMFLDFHQSGERIQRRILVSSAPHTLVDFPVQSKHRGGFSVSLSLLRDHQLIRLTRTVFVPWDDKKLKLEFATFRDLLRPGQKETWKVVVQSAANDAPAKAAELLAYMYDRSLDAFALHVPISPLSIYPGKSQFNGTKSCLGQARSIWLSSDNLNSFTSSPGLRSDILNFESGIGIGGPGQRRFGQHSFSQVSYAPPTPFTSRSRKGMGKAAHDTGKDPSNRNRAGKIGSSQPQKEEVATSLAIPQPDQIRTDFSETAFFQPHLLTGVDGSAAIAFEVPYSVGSWNVWVHAITKDLRSGSLKKEVKTIKELMVRPYLPRFLRESDQVVLKVVINNASNKKISGQLDFDIIDPASKESRLSEFGLNRESKNFEVRAKGDTSFRYKITTPNRLGQIAIKAVARSGDFSDGEIRPIPILPSRMHLSQSRFVTLKGKTSREMEFKDMASTNDSTRINQQLVVTIDAQLFYSVLAALPYLIDYPFECTEQTLNRFISTGILSSLYFHDPTINRMAKKFSQRKTPYESFDQTDPNRKMALAETPWLQQSAGDAENPFPLINALDPKITQAQKEAALLKLQKAQTFSGGFPWFSGGRPSPYMTLYLLHGFSKGLEFGVRVPKPMIIKAWRYLHRHYLDEILKTGISHDGSWKFVTFLNYTLSNFADDSWSDHLFSKEERKQMLDLSFKHWKKHSPYLKGYLALTLKRMGREPDGKMVWASVMDSAQTEQDQGTFWAPEDRAWLWYHDRIESHAFAIKTTMEMNPQEKKLDGLVLWLFLNKKLSHWKSTRATAEAIYALAHYLRKTNPWSQREIIDVSLSDLHKNFVFDPDEYTGHKKQLIVAGDRINPAKHNKIQIKKETRGFALAQATWHFSTEQPQKKNHGDFISVDRTYFKRVKTGRGIDLEPLSEGARLSVGDEVEVHLSLRTKHPLEYVHLRDPRAAGFEPASTTSEHKWNLGIAWYQEIRDSGTNFFFESLPKGEYPFSYRLRATTQGTFRVGPATVQPMYAPEFSAYSTGGRIQIAPAERSASQGKTR